MSIVKPHKVEDLYIMKEEFERKQKKLEEAHEHLKKEEKARLKKLHHMRCPKCGMELVSIHYQDVEVDECSHCQGLWLDQGELDTILSKEGGFARKFFGIFQASSGKSKSGKK